MSTQTHLILRMMGVWIMIRIITTSTTHSLATDRPSSCDSPMNRQLPFCNINLSLDERINDLLERIPESVYGDLLSDNATNISSLDIPSYHWWNEGLHGIAKSPGVYFDFPTPFATSFPQVIGLGCTFNADLIHRIGVAISTEARAFHNNGNAGLTYWAPNLNIYRDPRWGRGQETPGEDPYLSSVYVYNFVKGMQDVDTSYTNRKSNREFPLKVSACCKHFSAYSQEVPRESLNAQVSLQDLGDTYLPVFETCVTKASASCIMCSYNAVNGIPSCADPHFLTKLLREKWAFDGYITSDCGAIYDVLYRHNFTSTPDETVLVTLEAGLDLNCGEFYRENIVPALKRNVIEKEKHIYRSLRHLFKVQMRLGLFQPSEERPFRDISTKDINTPEHQALALEAAEQSLVLLKNQNQVLPLLRDSYHRSSDQNVKRGNSHISIGEEMATKQRISIIGPHLNATQDLLGNYEGIPPFIISPLDGMKEYVPNVESALGCEINALEQNETLFSHALDLTTRTSETVVMFVGLNQKYESEAMDRQDILLPSCQINLIEKVLEVLPSSTTLVLVIISGGSLDLEKYSHDDRIGAILYCGYPGQAGGQAIAKVLFGETNPSGKLSHSFYTSESLDQVQMSDMNMRPGKRTMNDTKISLNPGRTYRFYTQEPVYEFGFGLSYTTFDVTFVSIYPYSTISADSQQFQITVQVQNNGKVAGDHVILIYAKPPLDSATSGLPIKSLVQFHRVSNIQPNEIKIINCAFKIADTFSAVDLDGQRHIIEGSWTLEAESSIHLVHLSNPTSIIE